MSRKKNHVKLKKKKTVTLRTDQKIKRKKDLKKKKKSRHCSQKVKIIIIINNALKGANAHKSRQKKKKGKKMIMGRNQCSGQFCHLTIKLPHTIFSSFWRDKFQVGPGGKCLGPTKKFPLPPSLPNNTLSHFRFYFLSKLFHPL